MLKVLNIRWLTVPTNADDGNTLFKLNPTISFDIEAPMYWWIDCDWIKYYLNMPLGDFNFCLDEFEGKALEDFIKAHGNTDNLTPRQLMQVLPMSIVVKATIDLTYKEIVEVCENYIMGEYQYTKGYGFPNENEWSDFCEVLLNIKGIKELMEDE